MSTWVSVVDRVIMDIAVAVLTEWIGQLTLVGILGEESSSRTIIVTSTQIVKSSTISGFTIISIRILFGLLSSF